MKIKNIKFEGSTCTLDLCDSETGRILAFLHVISKDMVNALKIEDIKSYHLRFVKKGGGM